MCFFFSCRIQMFWCPDYVTPVNVFRYSPHLYIRFYISMVISHFPLVSFFCLDVVFVWVVNTAITRLSQPPIKHLRHVVLSITKAKGESKKKAFQQIQRHEKIHETKAVEGSCTKKASHREQKSLKTTDRKTDRQRERKNDWDKQRRRQGNSWLAQTEHSLSECQWVRSLPMTNNASTSNSKDTILNGS